MFATLLQAWAKAEGLFAGRPAAPSQGCTRVDMVHDLPYPQDNQWDADILHAEEAGLASTPTVTP